MIRNDSEYKEAVSRVNAEKTRLGEHYVRLQSAGLTVEEAQRAIEPMQSFHLQLVDEIGSYERLKRREFQELENFKGAGRLLIALRIANGLSQRELASRLGVNESQVSRDERNEYFGVTLERAGRIIDALGERLTTRVESEPTKTNRVLENA